ncbi:uncharacterized protein LOC143280428 [Babylonia areolata]|uniref:uncharacterized protein LOC143280428 n=1 Tax=Babylonia areolata TaxID=304850 RepID=UPI003FD4244C
MAYTMDNANDHIEADVYNIFLPVTCRVTSDGRLEKCLGRNKLHLMVVKDCSLPDFIRHFVKVRDNIQGMTDFSFVETRDVTAFRLELTTEETRKQNWYMNNDGEPILLESNVFYFRVHPRMFQAFGPPED